MTTTSPAQSQPGVPQHGSQDPLAAVLDLGWQASRVGIVVGLVVALFGHSMAFAKPMFALHDMFEAVQGMRVELSEFYWTTYDVAIAEPDKPAAEETKPDEPPPEPDPVEPEAAPIDPVPVDTQPEVTPPPPSSDDTPPPTNDDPYEEPPDQASDSGDTLTADSDAVDMTGEGWDMVDNDGSDAKGTGYASSSGKGDRNVSDPNARPDGTPGARGTATAPVPRPPPPPAVNLSRSARPTNMGVLRGCPFPPQADVAQVDRATVLVTVRVGASGRALSANANDNPGYGFASQARRCAMAAPYQPALNSRGKKVTASVSLRFRFSR